MDWIISPLLDPASLKQQKNPFDFSTKSVEEEDLSLGSARSVRIAADSVQNDFVQLGQGPNAFSLFGDGNLGKTRQETQKKRFGQTKTLSLRQNSVEIRGGNFETGDQNVSKNRSKNIKKDHVNRKNKNVRPQSEFAGQKLVGPSQKPLRLGKNVFGQSGCESFFSEAESDKRVKSHFGFRKKNVKSGFSRQNTKSKRPRFKKIFDPRQFYEELKTTPESENLREKFNIFLFLPQLLLLNNMCTRGKGGLEVESRCYESRRIATGKGGSETNTNVSLSTSQRFSTKSGLTEDQKHRKISKKLRRAWNLNQQISVNIFKKQVRFLGPERSAQAEKLNPEGIEMSEKDVFGMKRVRKATTQRRSKLEAKNKIKKSMMRQRKLRAPLGEEKEHLEYKRLVGLKRDLGEFRRDCGQETRGRRHFDGPAKTPREGRNFEYVEFLDFSFKNINKPNFLAANVQPK